MAYLTQDAAAEHLEKFAIEATPTDGDLTVASTLIDQTGVLFDDEPPEDVLDAVALLAYQIGEDEGAPVISESAGSVSVTYAGAKTSPITKRIEALIWPHGGRLQGYIG